MQADSATPAVVPYFGKAESDVGLIGPTKGFSPQIGVLVSMLAFTRIQVMNCVKRMSADDLDFLIDPRANTIGATLLHLAATEIYYQLNTFEGIKWGEWPGNIRQIWDVPMKLGDEARRTIKGNSIDYYLSALNAAREKTLAEFAKRDDEWLSIFEPEWKWNNHAKWFHVAEHESNHNGQFKFFRSRLPGAQNAT